MKPPGLDLLVVDYHSPAQLTRFLESLDDDLDGTVSIGIVECAGDLDPSYRAAISYADQRPAGTVNVVTWADNIGYNRAVNRLGAIGSNEVIACCNADVRFLPDTIPQLTWATWAHPEWGPVGPRQMGRNRRLTAGGIFGTATKPRHRGWKASTGYDDIRDDAIIVAGAVLFLRRDVWDELTACEQYQSFLAADNPEPPRGPWLDTQHYYGDTYLSMHASAHGYRCVFYGATTVFHDVGGKKIKERDRPDRARYRAACDHHGIPHE